MPSIVNRAGVTEATTDGGEGGDEDINSEAIETKSADDVGEEDEPEDK